MRHFVVSIEHIYSQGRSSREDSHSPEGIELKNQIKLNYSSPGVTIMMSNSLSRRCHRAVRPDIAGLNKRLCDQLERMSKKNNGEASPLQKLVQGNDII